MLDYVVGLVFDLNERLVLVQQKNRGPRFNIGKWNGIGGKIEDGETPPMAMSRECAEETGLDIPPDNWFYQAQAHLGDRYGTLHVFATNGEYVGREQQLEDEPLMWIEYEDFYTVGLVPNLKWLIPLCLDDTTQKPVLWKVGNDE
jgi:8-oxo-dGTP pyrophosphatase MutT (NUDIX family)